MVVFLKFNFANIETYFQLSKYSLQKCKEIFLHENCPIFSLLFQNKSSYLQCSTFESGDEGSPNNFAAGIFYV